MGGGRDYLGVAFATAVVGAGAILGATSTDDTGPILAFVGALLVAVITAYTADRHLRQQLAHDRELHDLDSLRALLVRASTAMFSTVGPLATIKVELEGKEGPPADIPDEALDGLEALQDRHAELVEMWAELSLYFDEDDAIYAAFERFRLAAVSVLDLFVTDPRLEELAELMRAVPVITGESADEFRRGAREAASYTPRGKSRAGIGSAP
jgi:hypothetical protein